MAVVAEVVAIATLQAAGNSKGRDVGTGSTFASDRTTSTQSG
jgi:hypothetical protein